MGTIKNFIENIKKARYGKDVRQSIVDALEQTYDDAIANGHTDMEVVKARDKYDNLNSRLEADKTERIESINKEAENRKNAAENLQSQINGLASGSPLVASSMAEMTDTTRIYVNTADGHWYYYNGTNWVVGGKYQAPEDSKSVDYILETIDDFFIEKTYKSSKEPEKWNKSSPLLTKVFVPLTIKKSVKIKGFNFIINSSESDNVTISIKNLLDTETYFTTQYALINGENNISISCDLILSPGEYKFYVIANSKILNYPSISNYDNNEFITNVGTQYLYNNNKIRYSGYITYNSLSITSNDINNINDELNNKLNKFIIKNYEEIFNIRDMVHWGNPFDTTFDENSVTLDISDKTSGNGGFKTQNLLLNNLDTTMLKLRFDCIIEQSKISLFFIGKKKSDTTKSTLLLFNTITESGHYDIDIDMAYHDVYSDIDLTQEFSILFANKDNPAKFTVSNPSLGYTILENRLLKKENQKLGELLTNIQNDIDAKTEKKKELLISPNGSKYYLNVSDDGSIHSVPVIPSKALFIGNSLLLGWSEFGMCATDNQHDYYKYVTDVLTQLNPNFTSSKVSGTSFEGATNDTAYNNFIANIDSKLTSDLDLIIIQLSDNVNTEEKLAYFTNSCTIFSRYVRNKCHNARVVWVAAWYFTETKLNIIKNACESTGCDFVNISDLKKDENQGHIGDIITFSNGTTKTVETGGQASHPGNAGMLAIANRICFTLGYTDSENDILSE